MYTGGNTQRIHTDNTHRVTNNESKHTQTIYRGNTNREDTQRIHTGDTHRIANNEPPNTQHIYRENTH